MNFNDLYKIKLRSHSDSQMKHEVAKLLVVKNIIEKYHKTKRWQEIYTEFPIAEGKVCDIFHHNLKTKEVIVYEVQLQITKDWLERTTDIYSRKEVYGSTFDWVLIKLKELSNDINKMNKQIKELIV